MNRIEHLPYCYTNKLMEIESEFMYSVIMDAIKKYVPTGARILDIGSGRGELMEKLAKSDYQVYGCDMDDECVRLSKRFGETLKINVNDISPDTFGFQFDCIILSHVLEHLDNPREALKKLVSITKGLMVISVPNPYDSMSVMRSLVRREIKYTNTGHLAIWDWTHLKTFIEVGCDMEILEFYYDFVALPVPNRLRQFLGNRGLLRSLEGKYLKAAFPGFCRSITAVVNTKSP